MQKWIAQNIKGDKVVWAIILVFTLLSFLAVYSASTNLVYVVGKGTTFGHFIKHGFLMGVGFVIIYLVHKVPYRFSRPISKIGIVLAAIFLVFAAVKGTVIAGANASRWIEVPFVGVSFQPSTFAFVMIMIYVASYLAENFEKKPTFSDSFWPLWMPVGVTIILIVPSNLSTSLLVAFSVITLTFIGKLPMRNILNFLSICAVGVVMFYITAKAFPELLPSRASTWISRIDSFTDSNENSSGRFQIERAKMAIAKGGFLGEGAGKSTMKNFLPQSSSDFIYAIITEEYGSFGALIVLLLYMLLLFRIMVISMNARTVFGQLLVLGMGLPIIFQAFINMGVAVEIFPVTGQNLPLISSGGTSIWMTCLALGLILSVSTSKRNKEDNLEKDKNIEDVEEELAEGIIKGIHKGNAEK
ncbi:FtsW/RodA/SpoVE family cell cycle protein [Capnocytophaga canis]|uniref:FtsW/RodA/SpoVE family cell cycle protein n=1 Tax=Capnocytophaga canis TaxID=1848903 RepID=UPI0037D76119